MYVCSKLTPPVHKGTSNNTKTVREKVKFASHTAGFGSQRNLNSSPHLDQPGCSGRAVICPGSETGAGQPVAAAERKDAPARQK